MRRGIIAFLLVMSIIGQAKAQDYKTGLGLRAGSSWGLTVKHFESSKAALEGILAFRWEGFGATGLYEVHNKAFEVDHLYWYYGGGAHIGFYNGDNVSWGTNGTVYTVIGIDGILGIEYTFREAPINIGIDWKPALNLIGYYGLWSEGAISVRYVF